MRAWVAALVVEQDEATVDACGNTYAPGVKGHDCIEIEGVCADGSEKCHANNEAERRTVDGIASPSADGAAEHHANDEDKRLAVDGIASPRAGTNAEGYAAKRHVPDELEGGGPDDTAARLAVDGNASPRAGTSTEGCNAKRQAAAAGAATN